MLNCIAGCMRTVFSTRWHGLRVARTVEEVLISLARTAILSTGCSNAEKRWSRPSYWAHHLVGLARHSDARSTKRKLTGARSF